MQIVYCMFCHIAKIHHTVSICYKNYTSEMYFFKWLFYVTVEQCFLKTSSSIKWNVNIQERHFLMDNLSWILCTLNINVISPV